MKFDDEKEYTQKYGASKFEYDLYHEADDIALPVIRIKKSKTPNKGEKWKVIKNDKTIFIIESTKISKSDRAFLQTVEGFQFILNQAKSNVDNFPIFKRELKKFLKQ